MRGATALLIANAAASALLAPTAPTPTAPPGGAFRHAYYLFLIQRPVGCEDCYVPLLFTSHPLEELAKQKRDETCVVVPTYERDSIVGFERDVPVPSSAVEPRGRQLRLRERLYRYQEVSAPEVLRLLEHPEGTIPISRTSQMAVPAPGRLKDLIASFRGRN